jgi:hypothetical protein
MKRSIIHTITAIAFALSTALAVATLAQVASAAPMAGTGCGDACNYLASGACAGQMCSNCAWYDPDLKHECQKPTP